MPADRCLGLGILGAARNVPFSVLEPLQKNADLSARIKVVGLASLEKAEAEVACKQWNIPKAYASFDELLADPAIDAVYNVLPNGVRCAWTVKALLAGKHVLSETPSAPNGLEAMLAQRAAEDMGRVLLEGTHPTCHPVTKRVREIIMEGKIGKLEHIDLDMPVGHSLQGKMVCSKTGALMGVGCHGAAIIRSLSGEEPQVISAVAQYSSENKDVDTVMSCNFKLPSGAAAHMGCSVVPTMAKAPTKFVITGTDGVIRVQEWFTGQGQSSNEIAIENFAESGDHSVERVANTVDRDTFYFQLKALADEISEQEKGQNVGMPWSYTHAKGPVDSVLNMALIDSIYKKAGMKARTSLEMPEAPYNNIRRSKL
eukprot:TRINITY_DN3944_c3_g1_i1.p1 TRINITY_DN3944_c3_g1~~TRINITY_DN3944_c3_g1_i1.p1  ORF type:complete len:370 (+),score=85.84 TRINITY_DN3944_c3_g1_i1:106-1215(+)